MDISIQSLLYFSSIQRKKFLFNIVFLFQLPISAFNAFNFAFNTLWYPSMRLPRFNLFFLNFKSTFCVQLFLFRSKRFIFVQRFIAQRLTDRNLFPVLISGVTKIRTFRPQTSDPENSENQRLLRATSGYKLFAPLSNLWSGVLCKVFYLCS